MTRNFCEHEISKFLCWLGNDECSFLLAGVHLGKVWLASFVSGGNGAKLLLTSQQRFEARRGTVQIGTHDIAYIPSEPRVGLNSFRLRLHGGGGWKEAALLFIWLRAVSTIAERSVDG